MATFRDDTTQWDHTAVDETSQENLPASYTTPSWLSPISTNEHHEDYEGIHNPIKVKADWDVCKNITRMFTLDVNVTCALDLYLPPILFVTGLVSNVLVILVMRSKYFRNLSTSFYMTLNAVADSLSLFVALPVHYLFVNFHGIFDGLRDAHPMCAFFNVLGWGTSDLGILLTVAMTTERAIAIRFPLKAYRLCSMRRAKFVVFGLVLFEIIKLSHFFYYSEVVGPEVTSRLCDIARLDPTVVYYSDKVWPWLHIAILAIAYTLVVIGNAIIVTNIKRSSAGATVIGGGRKFTRKDSTIGSKNRQLSIMLVIDSCFLVLFTLPFAVISILISQFGLLPSVAGKNFAFTATFYVLYTNRCLNFFLYCVSGTRFRVALREMFTCSSKGLSTTRSISRDGRRSLPYVTRRNSQHDSTEQTREAVTPTTEGIVLELDQTSSSLHI